MPPRALKVPPRAPKVPQTVPQDSLQAAKILEKQLSFLSFFILSAKCAFSHQMSSWTVFLELLGVIYLGTSWPQFHCRSGIPADPLIQSVLISSLLWSTSFWRRRGGDSHASRARLLRANRALFSFPVPRSLFKGGLHA